MGGYAGLADAGRYRDETTGEYDLPTEIEGVAVVGIEDDMVVGGELTWFDDDDTIEFDRCSSQPSAPGWVTEAGGNRAQSS